MPQQAGPDRAQVVAAIRPEELPADLAGYAKKNAHRKVNRLLERVSVAPFAAGLSLYRSHPVGDPDRVALLTVSGWDPDTPVAAGDELTEQQRGEHYLRPTGVGGYLQRMPNNAICQLSIAGGFRGPNVHYTGGVDSLALLVTVALGHLADGSSDCALVVAYDVPEEQRHALPDTADANAAAVLLAPQSEGDAVCDAEELLAALAAVPRPSGAVAGLCDALIAGATR